MKDLSIIIPINGHDKQHDITISALGDGKLSISYNNGNDRDAVSTLLDCEDEHTCECKLVSGGKVSNTDNDTINDIVKNGSYVALKFNRADDASKTVIDVKGNTLYDDIAQAVILHNYGDWGYDFHISINSNEKILECFACVCESATVSCSDKMDISYIKKPLRQRDPSLSIEPVVMYKHPRSTIQ